MTKEIEIERSVRDENNSLILEETVVASKWFDLPFSLSDMILLFLSDVDMLGVLNCVINYNKNPDVAFLKISEIVCKPVCERIYLSQSAKGLINLSNFKNSYYYMLTHRSRLRTNGIYSVRTTYTKPYSNDAFWEEKRFERYSITIIICKNGNESLKHKHSYAFLIIFNFLFFLSSFCCVC